MIRVIKGLKISTRSTLRVNHLRIFRPMSLVALVILTPILHLIHTRTADIVIVILEVVIAMPAIVPMILVAIVPMILAAAVAVTAAVVEVAAAAATKLATTEHLSDCYDLLIAITFFIRSSSLFVHPARNTC